ncbi:MAG: type IV toxin-antitoxin system AbiEi family antitoxin [Calditrichaceae bacterium]
MVKAGVSVKISEKNILEDAKNVLVRYLKDIPFIKINNILSNIKNDKVQADLWVKFSEPQNCPDIVVVVKNSGEPRIIRDAVNQLLRYLEYIPNAYGLISAPYISEKSAEICKESGIGYMDLSGNYFLSFGQVYIKKEGKSNPKLENKVLKSIYYPKAERILRVLLNNPHSVWQTEKLAKEANVSLGLVSKVRQRLDAMEWIVNKSSGYKLSEWDALLQDWAKNFKFTKNKMYNFYSLKTNQYIEEQLKAYCIENNTLWGLTSFSGASRLAPYTRQNRLYAYFDGDIEKLTNSIDLKSVPSGQNVVLIKPYDNGVFYNSTEKDNIPVVSAIQIYLDLIQNKGRGEEAAEFLYEKVIKKSWLQSGISKNGM